MLDEVRRFTDSPRGGHPNGWKQKRQLGAPGSLRKGSQQGARSPKIGVSTPYVVAGKNLTAYGTCFRLPPYRRGGGSSRSEQALSVKRRTAACRDNCWRYLGNFGMMCRPLEGLQARSHNPKGALIGGPHVRSR